jgi:hypothetical protein
VSGATTCTCGTSSPQGSYLKSKVDFVEPSREAITETALSFAKASQFVRIILKVIPAGSWISARGVDRHVAPQPHSAGVRKKDKKYRNGFTGA